MGVEAQRQLLRENRDSRVQASQGPDGRSQREVGRVPDKKRSRDRAVESLEVLSDRSQRSADDGGIAQFQGVPDVIAAHLNYVKRVGRRMGTGIPEEGRYLLGQPHLTIHVVARSGAPYRVVGRP